MWLAKRQNSDAYCYDTWGNVFPCNSAWYDWGRWVTLVIVIIGLVLFFFLCSCLSARRRRRRGARPYYGTGWTGQAPWGHGQAQYNPNYNYQQPQYSPYPPQQQHQGQYGGYYAGPPSYAQSSQPTGDSNRGYYGGGQGNQEFEMQSPQRVYQDQGQAPEVHGVKK